VKTRTCKACAHDFPTQSTFCIHCGREQYFSNVDDSDTAEERAALDLRYQTAVQVANLNSTSAVVSRFEATSPEAVMSCPFRRIEELISGEKDLYATFHQRRQLRASANPGSKIDWDEARLLTERKLFGNNKKFIHYAALTLSDSGPSPYGNCHVFLKESMIGHRASVFEQNSVTFMRDRKVSLVGPLPAGYRTIWKNRMKLAVAKLVGKFTPATTDAEFPIILLDSGTTTADGEFIEVHVFGTMTLRTFKLIIVEPGKSRRDLKIKVLRERCRAIGLELTVLP